LSAVDLTELAVPPIRAGIAGPEAVRHVVGFGSNFHPLAFHELKSPRQSHIERPTRRPTQLTLPQISESADGRVRKSSGIEPYRSRPSGTVEVGIGAVIDGRLAAGHGAVSGEIRNA
jgi:hypothetical protein